MRRSTGMFTWWACLFIVLTCSIGASQPAPAADGVAFKIAELSVQEPSGLARSDWPITSGIPFARGELRETDRVRLIETENGRELPLQTRITCRWPDGSVKWLLADTRVSLKAGERKALRVEYGPDVTRPSQTQPSISSIRHQVDNGITQIATGPLQAKIDAHSPNLPGPVWFDFDGDGRCADDEQVSINPWVLVLETAEGQTYRSDVLPAEIKVEEAGPLRTAVRIEGQLADANRDPRFRYVARLHFYAGKPFVKAFVTLTVDVPDQVMVDIRSFKLVLPANERGEYKVAFGGEESKAGAIHSSSVQADGQRLFQVDDQKYRVDGRDAGRRAAGWASWTGRRSCISAGVRNFWQQWPKGTSASKNGLTIELIPPCEKGLYDNFTPTDESKWTYALRHGRTRIKEGVAKTHEVWVCYGGNKGTPQEAAAVFRQAFEPLLATCEPSYICATKTLGDFPPADPADPDRFMGYDRIIAQAFQEHMAYREKTREYGLLNFGDWWGERGYNWGNLEYDMQRGFIAQYARTGRREYYLRAEEAARHHIDVDVVHAVNPQLKNCSGPPPVVGNVWVHATGHTGGYLPDESFGMERPYTVGYSLNLGHIWDRGDLDYYFLSGDEQAREVGLLIAETLRRDAAPNFKIGTHMRDIGWPMLAMMAAYRATGDAKYLDGVRRGWEVLKKNEDPNGGWVVKLAKGHCLHEPTQCRGNVTFIMGIVISALCDYHRETGDPEVARTIVRAVDFTIRETYLPDRKMFRYTSCPLTPSHSSTVCLVSEALAYAYRLSGQERFRQVLQDAFATFRDTYHRGGIGKGFSQYIIFTPECLSGLTQRPSQPALP